MSGDGAVRAPTGAVLRVVRPAATAALKARLCDPAQALPRTASTSWEAPRLGHGFANNYDCTLVGGAARARRSLGHNGSGGHVAYATTTPGDELALCVLCTEYKPVGLNGKTSVQPEALELAAAVRADVRRCLQLAQRV